jgi:hypothetical protein
VSTHQLRGGLDALSEIVTKLTYNVEVNHEKKASQYIIKKHLLKILME